jgi:MFS family permease
VLAATVPAYLKDMFGTRYVGAIHGLLLTAWSMAGIFGPVLVNYIREYNITHGVPKAQAYNVTMYIMAGLFVIGFIANLLVKAVDKRYHMVPDGETALVPSVEHLAFLPRNGAEEPSVGGDGQKQSPAEAIFKLEIGARTFEIPRSRRDQHVDLVSAQRAGRCTRR